MALDHGILVRIQARQHSDKLRAFRNDIPLSFWSEAIESNRSAVILERSEAKQSQLAFYFFTFNCVNSNNCFFSLLV